MRSEDKNAQSTIEYIVLMAIVIIIILVFAAKNGVFQNSLNSTVNGSLQYMTNMSDKILGN